MKPFIKWVGGKRQLLPTIKDMIPKSFDTYYEPFLGGGALLFEIAPEQAIVGDANTNLINTYKAIQNNKESLKTLLDEYTEKHGSASNKKEFYNEMRRKYNDTIQNNPNSIEASSLFIYLNKTCFNGLYRVNSKGMFNVPFNNREKINLYDASNLDDIAEYLSHVVILNEDFEETCKTAKKGDFVFFDSPYAPLKPESFEAYTKEGFTLDDHKRLAMVFHKLSEKGVFCMLTNHNTDLIRELYYDCNIKIVPVKRMINSDASKRTGEEVIITNY